MEWDDSWTTCTIFLTEDSHCGKDLIPRLSRRLRVLNSRTPQRCLISHRLDLHRPHTKAESKRWLVKNAYGSKDAQGKPTKGGGLTGMNQRVGGADSDRAERLRGGTICGRKPIAEMEPFTRGKTRSSLHADGTTSPGSRPLRCCVAFTEKFNRI